MKSISARPFAAVLVLLAAALLAPRAAEAGTVTVTPITWDVIGLDSNAVTVGPNHFPVGARVCNTGASPVLGLVGTFNWDDGLDKYSGHPYVNLRGGTLAVVNGPASLGVGACTDLYYEVAVTRTPAAYDETRRYHISVSADGGTTTGSTPRPRQLYVERLISQSRNYVYGMALSSDGSTFSDVANGASMTLLVGKTYWIRLDASTATQGYEQIESFVNFPNTIFRVKSVETTYSADTSANYPPVDKLYGDGCSWEANPLSPNYRSCNSTGKLGGTISVLYEVEILSVPGAPLLNPEPLSTLVHDFSGSSYHYNADFGVTTRYAYVLDPTTLAPSKSFVPTAITPGGVSKLYLRIPNPTPGELAGVSITDPLPAGMTVANPPSASLSACGAATFSPSAGQTSLSLTGATIPASSTCVVSVDVTSSTQGTHLNTTNNLFVNGTTDTGNKASAALTVASSLLTCTTGTLAQWTVPATATNPPDTTGGNATTRAANVSTAVASALAGTGTSILTNTGQNDSFSWETYGYATAGRGIQFRVQTKNWEAVGMSFWVQSKQPSNGPQQIQLLTSTDGTNFTQVGTINGIRAQGSGFVQYTFSNLVTSTTGDTWFRLTASGSNNNNPAGGLNYDLITFTGCSYVPPPTLTKSFGTDPILLGTGTSLLTFTVSNPSPSGFAIPGSSPTAYYDAQPLTGVGFSDTLPTGLTINSTPAASTTCTGGTLGVSSDMQTISLSGASLAVGGTCTVTVSVRGTAPGLFLNVSGFVGATQSGQNQTATGYATDDITVLAPPIIAKSFEDATILTGEATRLSFTVVNPNAGTTLTGVSFTDALPAGLVVATPNGLTGSCGAGTITATAGSGTVSLGGANLAPLASCTFSVDVTGTTAGTKANSVTVTSTNGGTGNTATATLEVKAPNPAIALLKQVGLSSDPDLGTWRSFLATSGGTPLWYKLTIENTGDVTLSPVSVTDPLVSLASCTWPASLAPGVTATCVAGPVSAAVGSHENTATASGTSGTLTVSDRSTATYSTTGLTLVKIVAESSFNAAGVVLRYTYGVTNTGAVRLLGPVTVSDDKTSVTCPSTTTVGNGDGYLDPLESLACTATYTTTAADVTAGRVTNVATAAAGGVSSNTASRTVPLADAIDLVVTKSDGAVKVESGGSVTYTIEVKNDGPSADGATLSDPDVPGVLTKTSVGPCFAYGGATCPAPGPGELSVANLQAGSVVIPSLPNGGSLVFTVTARVDATSPPIVNTVTVTAGSKTEVSTANNSAADSNVLAENFGHLPAAYAGMNLLADGGARTLTGSTYLGYGVTTADDGINTAGYTPKATDDGVTWTPGVAWTAGGTGSIRLTRVACPSGPCALNAWIDWNGDGDFGDEGEQVFTNQVVNAGTNLDFTFSIPASAASYLDGRTIYSRFRLTNAPMNPSSPSGPARNGTTPLVGEIEDPFFQIKNGSTPTPVTVARFEAERRGGRVSFRWSTATESANVGFNVYAVEGKGLRALNTELVPSSVFDSLEPQSYAWEADVAEDVFVLEDVDVWGRGRRHGPFRTGEEYGELPVVEKSDRTAIRAESAAKRSARQSALKKSLKVPAAALEPPAPGGAAWLLKTTLNLKVRTTGIHRLTYEQIRDAGLDLEGVPAAKIALTNGGREVPIWVESKGAFGPGAFLEFHGEALDTIYTDTNVYTLQVNRTNAERISTVSGLPAPGQQVPASYDATLVVNNQKAFARYAPGEDAWYDTSMLVYKTAKSWAFPFEVTGLASGAGPVTLDLVVWGATDWPQSPDHHLEVSLNGVALGDELFDGLVERVLRMEVPSGALRNGSNVLTLRLPGDSGVNYEMVNLDRFAVSYPRRFQAEKGKLVFTADARTFQVTDLPSANVVVYRLGGRRVERLDKVRVEASGAGYRATFAGAKGAATYVVSTVEGLLAPELEATRLDADLSARADYLVIAHPDFLDGIEPLVAARRAEGLSVSVVDVTDLYARYTHGVFDPAAIRDYVAEAVEELGVRTVLLVGGDTYDYRNFLGRNSVSFVPSLYMTTSQVARFVPVDPLFADVDGDLLPDVPIGRLPVRSSAELATLVAKTLAYDRKDYGRTAFFSTDKRDGGLSFKTISDGFAVALPPTWSRESVHLDDLSVAEARKRLLAGMNRGTALVTFTGHSGPANWTYAGLFSTQHAAALTNASRPFVVVQWGCWNTYYVDPVNSYLVHSFLFSGDRGAAAVLGATTLTDAESERLLGVLLTPRLARPGTTVGEALQEAKDELAQTHPDRLDVLLGWSLMGDPALRIDR